MDSEKHHKIVDLIIEFIFVVFFLEVGFNFIDYNYEPFDRIIYQFTSLFEGYGINQYLTVLISIIITIIYLIICYVFNFKRYKNLFIECIAKSIAFSFSFISTMYLLQIFDLPRSYILLICILFLPSIVFVNFLLNKYTYVVGTLLFVALIYSAQIILPVDKLSLFVESNFKTFNVMNPELNIEKTLERTTLYELNNEIYFKEELIFKAIDYKLNIFHLCCEEFDFYKQNMRNVGYLELFEDRMYMLNGFGDLFYFHFSNLYVNKPTELISVKTNLKEVINNKNIYSNDDISFTGQESVKGFQIHKNNIYISYIEEYDNSCVTLGILYGNLENPNINFQKLINFDQCVDRGSSNVQVSGGKMLFDDNYLYLTVGDFGNSELSQSPESIFGKILKISLTDNSWSIVSLGHRNPQGLEFTNNKELLIETEHGARYGDEINLINLNEVGNFGNPISSYSVHYGDLTGQDIYIENQPFNKSHKDFGFIEPIYIWGPDMPGGRNGVVDIIKNYFKPNLDSFFVASLSAGYLYEIDVDLKNNSISDIVAFRVGNRIRDIEYNKNFDSYFLLLENPPEIAILSKQN